MEATPRRVRFILLNERLGNLGGQCLIFWNNRFGVPLIGRGGVGAGIGISVAVALAYSVIGFGVWLGFTLSSGEESMISLE